MSRIGNKIIDVPAGVEVSIQGQTVKVKGPKGELTASFDSAVTVIQEDKILKVIQAGESPNGRALHGLTRALLSNMVIGVSQGFKRELQIIGVGYRAQIAGNKLTLNLGFSHPIDMKVPDGLKAEMDPEQKNTLVISGIDKQLVGQFAANIRRFRPPEPYKGKGIRYVGENVARKAGKSAAK